MPTPLNGDFTLDALTESIPGGLRRAAATLGELIGQPVELHVAAMEIRPADDMDDAAPHGDRADTLVTQSFHGAIRGCASVGLPANVSAALASAAAGTDRRAGSRLDVEWCGILLETGSLLLSGATQPLWDNATSAIHFSSPELQIVRGGEDISCDTFPERDRLLAEVRCRIAGRDLDETLRFSLAVDGSSQPATHNPQPASYDLVPLGVCVVDGDLRVHTWNEMLAAWTGLSEREMLHSDLGARYPRLRLPRLFDRLQAVLQTGLPTSFSAALHRQFLDVPARNGVVGELMVQETSVRRLSADPPRLVISIQDLTSAYHQLWDLRKERQELEGTKRDLEEANHSLQSSLVLYARNNQRLQAEVQERSRAEDVLRQQAADLSAAKDREAEHTLWLEHMVKELTAARQLAETAAQTKTEFLANMSHEIRTPMTAILGYVELLRDPELSEAERHQAIETVQRNGHHLLAIINDILDISKIEVGRMTLERLTCCPRQMIHDILELMSPRAVEKKLSLTADFIGVIPQAIQTDPTRVRQILVNLVGNALKFTAEGSVRLLTQFTAAVDGKPARLRIDVVDTGIGMTEKQVHNLFQPFTQADMTMTRQYGGTGLGLAISKRLANMLGGDISLASEHGRGSTFTVTLDPGDVVLSAAPAPEKDYAPTATACLLVAKPLDGRHILIVDDAPDNRKLLSFHLKKAGASFDLAENGAIAVEKVRTVRDTRPYDAILMDMQMPVLDGYGAAGTLRQDGDRSPIIALTAHAMTGDREKCLRAGCDDFLTKPIDRLALIDTLVRWTAKPVAVIAALG